MTQDVPAMIDLDRLVELLTAGKISGGWLVFGLAAQAVLIVCFVVQWVSSRRSGRAMIPAPILYAALIAVVMLLIYASARHDLVHAIGQLLNVLIVLRLLEMRPGPAKRSESQARFPVVEPESAEHLGPKSKQEPTRTG